MLRTDILDKKEEIVNWLKEELPLSEIARRLHCKYETLKSYLIKMNIEYVCRPGKKLTDKQKRYKPVSEYLSSGSSIKSHVLKLKLLKEGVREHRCELCGETTWLNQPIPLELHHIDGNHYNNTLSNLQLLCPNCHALQANNCGKNTQKHKDNERQKVELGKTKYNILVRKLNLKHSCDEVDRLQSENRVDCTGRVSDRILTEDEWKERKNVILNSGVDLMKYGWQHKVEIITGLTRRQISNTIKHYTELFSSISFIRN